MWFRELLLVEVAGRLDAWDKDLFVADSKGEVHFSDAAR